MSKQKFHLWYLTFPVLKHGTENVAIWPRSSVPSWLIVLQYFTWLYTIDNKPIIITAGPFAQANPSSRLEAMGAKLIADRLDILVMAILFFFYFDSNFQSVFS